MKRPEISIIMPIFNGEKYVSKAIDSILSQTFKDFEFIIINDASNDKTTEIINSYNDNRIIIVNNKENLGVTKSLNKALNISKGKYIARQDADDISDTGRLSEQYLFLEKNTNIAMAGTFAYIINDTGKIIQSITKPISSNNIRNKLKEDNCFIHGSVMIRRNILEEIGVYNESYFRSQDYELWLRMIKKHKIINIPQFLYLLRKHNDNIESKYIDEQKAFVVLAQYIHGYSNKADAAYRFLTLLKNNNYKNFSTFPYKIVENADILIIRSCRKKLINILLSLKYMKKIMSIMDSIEDSNIGETAKLLVEAVRR